MDEEDEKKVVVSRKAVDAHRYKIEKLMKNPDKPVFIPEKKEAKQPRVFRPPEFIRNIWGSSAGVGSGDFHIYRNMRRRQYAREKYMDQMSEKDRLDMEFEERLVENQQKCAEKTAKKRQKRQKKKAKQKSKKQKQTDEVEEESESESDEEEPEEILSVQPNTQPNTQPHTSQSAQSGVTERNTESDNKTDNTTACSSIEGRDTNTEPNIDQTTGSASHTCDSEPNKDSYTESSKSKENENKQKQRRTSDSENSESDS